MVMMGEAMVCVQGGRAEQRRTLEFLRTEQRAESRALHFQKFWKQKVPVVTAVWKWRPCHDYVTSTMRCEGGPSLLPRVSERKATP